MDHELPHRQTAWEWFGYGQTLALLPLNGNRSSLVLTLPPREIERLRGLDEDAFARELERRIDHRLGAMQLASSRHAYPHTIMWVYGSGFPKSLDVSKAIDKAAGAEREVVSEHRTGWAGTLGGKGTLSGLGGSEDVRRVTSPATDAARQWEGWGTALKPALEPITVARKPLAGTVAANMLAHGTGALNIDGCRIPTPENLGGGAYAKNPTKRDQMWGEDAGNSWVRGGAGDFEQPPGRWPANLIHDGSDEVVALFPDAKSTGEYPSQSCGTGRGVAYGWKKPQGTIYSDTGSAARFFYCAKASKADRDEGLEGVATITTQTVAHGERAYGTLPSGEPREMHPRPRANHHPTVKPTDLMRYLCRPRHRQGGRSEGTGLR
ncbi:hypothetical protein QU926_08420 [Pseudomonas asiatica]|uniref:hypothetical protein n=1 Tax=Pseudomonas asiatica TaxID=2219225 RepID=UPI0020A71D11|nr:hypothetical protein [Pseudomonas asiatica]MDM9553679.1 hypothetical protein [Pseudomonas asiatica]